MPKSLFRRVARRIAPALALLGLASVPATALAKDWVTLPARAPGAIGATPAATAVKALADDAVALDIVGLDLAPRLTTGAGSTLTVLLEQRHGGLRVVDRGGAIRFVGDDPRLVTLDVARSLSVSVVPTVDETSATLALAAKLGHPVAPFRSELAVLGRGAGILVWVLDVRADGTKYLVDAHTGKLVLRVPVLLDGKGRVYPVNKVQTPMTQDLPLSTLAEMASPVKLDGWNGLLRVTNYVSGNSQEGYNLEQTVTPTSGTDFLYDPPSNEFDPKDAFAQVNLYYHLTDIREFFAALGVDSTTNQWKLTAVANAMEDGAPLDNAFYSPYGQDGPFAAPNLIAIGQGDFIDFAYDSDVFKHEFGHYVAGNTSNFNMGPFFSNEFGLQPLSSGIDEGLADYFACSDNDSAILGEAALAPFGSERDLTDTHKRCPDDIGVESHADGELIGSVSWSLRLLLGQGRADKLVWGSESMLPPGATFGDFYQGILATMNGMLMSGELTDVDAQGIAQVLAERGMDDCGPIIALDGEETKIATIQGLELLAYYIGASCFDLGQGGIQFTSPFHFSRTTAPSDGALRFHVELEPDYPDLVLTTVYVRKGAHVLYTTDENGLPLAAEYDWAFSFRDEYSLDVVLDQASSPAFTPGETYFISVAGASCPNVRMYVSASNQGSTTTVTTSATSSGVGSTGSGSSSTGGEGGGSGKIIYIDRGCGCFVAPDATNLGGALAGLAIGAAALVRRRRVRR